MPTPRRTILALATTLAALGAAGRAPADGPGLPGLKRLLEESGLTVRWSDDGKTAWVKTAAEHTAHKSAAIYVPDEKGFYIKIALTVVDREEGHAFSTAVLEKILALNKSLWVVRFAWDEKYGDIDCIAGIDMEGLTGETLGMYFRHLVSTADGFTEDVQAALGGNTVGTPVSSNDGDVPASTPTWKNWDPMRWKLEMNHGKWQNFSSGAGTRWKFRVASAANTAFDAFVVSAAELVNYKRILDRGSGSFKSLMAKKNYERVTLDWTAPSAGDYALVVDNTDVPDDGAYYRGWFEVDITTEYLPGSD